MVSGWQYSFVAWLEERVISLTALLNVVRLHPDDDAVIVTTLH